MDNKIKIFGVIASVLILFVLSIVAADYFSMFGTKTRVELAFAEARFKMIDEDTGNLILGTGVRCFQKRNSNACTLRDSHQAGIVSVHVPYKRIVESTLLFTKNERIEKAADPNIHIMFINNNYFKITKSLKLEEFFKQESTEFIVKMKAVSSSESEES